MDIMAKRESLWPIDESLTYLPILSIEECPIRNRKCEYQLADLRVCGKVDSRSEDWMRFSIPLALELLMMDDSKSMFSSAQSEAESKRFTKVFLRELFGRAFGRLKFRKREKI